jgi:hypothetical protein
MLPDPNALCAMNFWINESHFDKRGVQYQVVVEIVPKYRGSFNTLVFGEIKPQSGSFKDGRLNLVYYQNRCLNIGDPFPLWTLH